MPFGHTLCASGLCQTAFLLFSISEDAEPSLNLTNIERAHIPRCPQCWGGRPRSDQQQSLRPGHSSVQTSGSGQEHPRSLPAHLRMQCLLTLPLHCTELMWSLYT